MIFISRTWARTFWGAGVTERFNVKPADEGPFVWIGQKLVRHNTAAGAATMPERDKLVRFEIMRSTRKLGRHPLVDQGFSDGWIPLRTVFGVWGTPFLWPHPVILDAHDWLTVERHQ